MPSAISFVVYLPLSGFIIVFDPGSFSITSSTLTICIPVVGEFTAAFAASSEFQKNPLPPAACTSVFFAAILSKYVAVLATDERFVIALKIEYLGSSISPNNCLNTLLPLPTAFSKLLVFTIPVLSW